VLPKAESSDDVTRLEAVLMGLEQERGLPIKSIAIQPIIETAKGVLNAQQVGAASRRVVSLVFGAVDYARDMRVHLTSEGWEVFHARSHVAVVARALGLVAVDSAWPAYADADGFLKDCRLSRQFGYEGRVLIHPSQIGLAHSVYGPSPEEIERAKETVTVFEEGLAKGLASVPLHGSMVDWPVYRAARDLLATAELIAERERARRERGHQSP
jgi:citrate lyase subunit beta/citryl-CoA lyase